MKQVIWEISKKVTVGILGFFSGFSLATLTIFALQHNLGLYWLMWDSVGGWNYLLIFLIHIIVPGFVGFIFARYSIQWYSYYASHYKKQPTTTESTPENLLAKTPVRKWILAIIFASYLFTWIFGVPAVQSYEWADAIREYKRMVKMHKEYTSWHQEVWDVHPYVRFFSAFPVLPGVIITHHERQLASLYGWGGWEFHLWHINGVKRLFHFSLWMS